MGRHLRLLDGEWPQKDHIAVERLSSQAYGIEIGDEIIFDLNGVDRAFPVTGKIRHSLVLPLDFGGQAYFFMDPSGVKSRLMPLAAAGRRALTNETPQGLPDLRGLVGPLQIPLSVW